ncbi:MAG: BrnT family toxin [Fibrobacter sp.]|nr:BrnT family toxin [Fibrobacter sp.]
MGTPSSNFEWDNRKNYQNIEKHNISFEIAQYAFNDPDRVIALDRKHSTYKEKRFFCYGKVQNHIVTVRFTWRNGNIRIFKAGYWREGKDVYYEKNKIY